jgi:RHS repeat-associated protein
MRETTYDYDDDGNQTLVRAPGAHKAPGDPLAPQVTTRVFDARGLLWTEATGSGTFERTTATEYDGNGNLRRRVNPAGVKRGADKTPRNADPGTLPTATSAWNEHSLVSQFDADNLLKATFLPWGRKNTEDGDRYQTQVDRNSLGQITEVYPPFRVADTPNRGRPTTYSHFDNGWIRTSRDNVATPPTFTYDYDGRGQQIEWTGTPNAGTPRRRTERTYWPNGVLKRRVARDLRDDTQSRTYDYEYNLNRSLTRMTDVNRSRVTAYSYDDLERQTLSNETWATDPQDTCQSFDANGNVKVRTTAARWDGSACGSGKTATFTFDEQDREIKAVIAQSGAPTRTTETQWHPSDELAERARTRSDNATRILDRRYFADDGRLTQHVRLRVGTATPLKDRTYAYDDATNGSTDAAQWGNGRRTNDEQGTYRFNSRGQMIQWTPSTPAGASTQNYSLDGLGQVKQVSGAGLLTTTYAYDGDQLQSITTGGQVTSYSYYELGELKKIDHADSTPDETYGYDAFSRLTSLDKGANRQTTYKYDGFDRREQRVTVDSAGATPKTTTSRMSYVGSTEELAQEATTGGGEADKTRSYDYDSALQRLGLSSQNGTGSIEYRAYLTDANGDVEGLEESDGRMLARYGYDPYGQDREADTQDLSDADRATGAGIAKDNPFRYQGKYLDGESSTYDMAARDYRPDIGRFLSPDRYEAADQDLRLQLDPSTNSRYAFLAGDPVDRLEFDGHEPESSFHDCYPGSIYCTPENPTPKQRERGRAIRQAVNTAISTARERVRQRQADTQAAQVAAKVIAQEVADRYCMNGNLCGHEKTAENQRKVYDALMNGKDLSKLELERESTDVPWWDPFNLLVGAGTGGLAAIAVKGVGKGTAAVLAGVFSGGARNAAAPVGREGIRQMIERTAQAQADQGEAFLLQQLTLREQAALRAKPFLKRAFLGTAVHRATNAALRNTFRNNRFRYNANRGPDFLDTQSGSFIELTTPRQVARHQARGGDYVNADYATYTLPE